MPFWQQQLREEISLAQVIPERGLRLPPDPASNATSQDTGTGMSKPVVPQKSMPNLWPMGTLEDRLGGPHLPDLESGMSTGMPWRI